MLIYALRQGETRVGSDEMCEVCLEDANGIAPNHCVFVFAPDGEWGHDVCMVMCVCMHVMYMRM